MNSARGLRLKRPLNLERERGKRFRIKWIWSSWWAGERGVRTDVTFVRACLSHRIPFIFYTCKRRPSERACILTVCACAERWSLPWLRLLTQLSPPLLLLLAAAVGVGVLLMHVTAQGTPLSVQMKRDGSLLAASGRSELLLLQMVLLLLQMVLLLLHPLLLPHRLKFFFQPRSPIYPTSLQQQQLLLLLLMHQRPHSIQLLLPLPPLSC